MIREIRLKRSKPGGVSQVTHVMHPATYLQASLTSASLLPAGPCAIVRKAMLNVQPVLRRRPVHSLNNETGGAVSARTGGALGGLSAVRETTRGPAWPSGEARGGCAWRRRTLLDGKRGFGKFEEGGKRGFCLGFSRDSHVKTFAMREPGGWGLCPTTRARRWADEDRARPPRWRARAEIALPRRGRLVWRSARFDRKFTTR